jgi:hypothetical protein
MNLGIPALIMLGPAGRSRAERWLAGAQLAAAQDLALRLRRCEQVESVSVLVASGDLGRAFSDVALRSPQVPFHFGKELAAWVEEQAKGPVAYFGAAGAPLITTERLDGLLKMVNGGARSVAQVNNLHSSDWLILSEWDGITEYLRTQAGDNGLGWGLREAFGLEVISHPALAAFRADIDTPADAAMLKDHPDVGRRLKEYLHMPAASSIFSRLHDLETVMEKRAGHLAVLGRSSSAVWQALEKNTQLWVRLLAEERGMVASGRVQRGEVKSLVSALIENDGLEGFLERLAQMAEAVLWDNRVWMASRGGYPSAADRFASDLGWSDEIDDPDLRLLTQAVERAPIPILMGGHGVVAGSLLAFLEALSSKGRLVEEVYQPSR